MNDLHFLVFKHEWGLAFMGATFEDGCLRGKPQAYMEIAGLDTLNRLQIAAVIGILRQDHDIAKEAIFYNGNWWKATHSDSPIGGCVRELFRLRLGRP